MEQFYAQILILLVIIVSIEVGMLTYHVFMTKTKTMEIETAIDSMSVKTKKYEMKVRE